MAARFINQLPQVADTELEIGLECMICNKEYARTVPKANTWTTTWPFLSTAGQASNSKSNHEIAVRLPCCSQIIGSKCIKEWLQGNGHNTCPLCRHRFPFPGQPKPYAPVVITDDRLISRPAIRPAIRSPRDTRLIMLSHRECLLYRQLRQEGSRLRVSYDHDALFEELIRVGAFNSPPGGQTRINDERRVGHLRDWIRLRDEGYVYNLFPCPGDRFRGGWWSVVVA